MKTTSPCSFETPPAIAGGPDAEKYVEAMRRLRIFEGLILEKVPYGKAMKVAKFAIKPLTMYKFIYEHPRFTELVEIADEIRKEKVYSRYQDDIKKFRETEDGRIYIDSMLERIESFLKQGNSLGLSRKKAGLVHGYRKAEYAAIMQDPRYRALTKKFTQQKGGNSETFLSYQKRY
jgi:hypothetical protein